jgi:hypothetical protein
LRYNFRWKDLTRPGTYVAVSYAWGITQGAAFHDYVVVEGEQVRVGRRVYSLLRVLAEHKSDTVLWIDSIGINHHQTAERNQQVALMVDIYLEASQVFVWLGDGDDDTSKALMSIAGY